MDSASIELKLWIDLLGTRMSVIKPLTLMGGAGLCLGGRNDNASQLGDRMPPNRPARYLSYTPRSISHSTISNHRRSARYFHLLSLAARTTSAMVGYTTFFVSAFLAIASSQAAPLPLDKRIVGSLQCTKTKVGRLALYNTKTSGSLQVTFSNDRHIDGLGHAPVLLTYPDVAPGHVDFEFWACTGSRQPGFENFPAEKDGVFYGHLSPRPRSDRQTGAPSGCTKHVRLHGGKQYLIAEDCNYSDDSGSIASYFSYSPGKHGQIDFLGYAGPQGPLPKTTVEAQGVKSFMPGTGEDQPAVQVHHGPEASSDWVLRLE